MNVLYRLECLNAGRNICWSLPPTGETGEWSVHVYVGCLLNP